MICDRLTIVCAVLACLTDMAAFAATSSAIAAFEDSLTIHLESEHGTGAGYAVVSDTEVVTGGVGQRVRTGSEGTLPVNADTVFPVASVSKLVTSLAVHVAAVRGFFSLDAQVDSLIGPGLFENPFSEPVLVRHLLDHTSGFKEILAPAPVPLQGFYPPALTLLKKLRTTPLVRHPPGLIPTYSNINYVLLMHLVEKTTGRPFDEFIAREIFIPAGMTRTSFRTTDYNGENLAQGYRHFFGRWVPVPVQEGFYRPAAGMLTTPRDLGRLLALIISGGRSAAGMQVLPEEAIAGLERLDGGYARATGMRTGHALGLVIREKSGRLLYGHNGITDGHMAAMFFNRAEKIGVALMFNSHLIPSGPSLSHAVDLALKKFFPDPPDVADEPTGQNEVDLSGIYFYENPRFELMRFSPWFDPTSGYLVIRKRGGDLFQGDLLNTGQMLLSAGDQRYRYAYERWGHIAFQKSDGDWFALDAPNRYFRRLGLGEFLGLHLPPLICVLIIAAGFFALFIDLLFLRVARVLHYAPQLALAALIFCLLFMTDSRAATSINLSTLGFFVISTLALPLTTVAFVLTLRDGHRLGPIRKTLVLANNGAGLLCFGLMAFSGFFAVLPGHY